MHVFLVCVCVRMCACVCALCIQCVRCMDTQGQLAVALEELDMALRREEQERTERVAAQTLLDAR